MLANDSYSTASTNVELTCVPDDTTGLERIMLAAQGDLQRLLSSYFGRPIFLELIYAHCSSRLTPASSENPITQSRQVHLVCASRTVCIATSTVTITSPQCERLFLDEKFPIGQTFRRLNRTPKFSLLNVETQAIDGKRELRRTYKLETEGFVAEILEVFPDRDMFVRGEAWLMEQRADLNTHSIATGTKPQWLSMRKGNTVH